jgi:hypothetical protein
MVKKHKEEQRIMIEKVRHETRFTIYVDFCVDLWVFFGDILRMPEKEAEN